MKKGETTNIRIYVACLAAYNAGHLHGRWIDANQDPYAIWEEVSAMLMESPINEAEEWAIHDYEGFGEAVISESESFDRVSEIAAFIAEHGEIAGQLVYYFGNLDDAKTAMQDHYAGEFESLSDFAREITEETQTVPDHLAHYIDYERMGRVMEINHVLTLETGFQQVHVFWQH